MASVGEKTYGWPGAPKLPAMLTETPDPAVFFGVENLA
jgi:hypothetical protein